jgi:hypothetical protein
MASRGRRQRFRKNLSSNSAKPLTITVPTASVWATRNYNSFRYDAMQPIYFRCPTTGFQVEWAADENENLDEGRQTFQSIVCPACIRLHFINLRNGKLLGEK